MGTMSDHRISTQINIVKKTHGRVNFVQLLSLLILAAFLIVVIPSVFLPSVDSFDLSSQMLIGELEEDETVKFRAFGGIFSALVLVSAVLLLAKVHSRAWLHGFAGDISNFGLQVGGLGGNLYKRELVSPIS